VILGSSASRPAPSWPFLPALLVAVAPIAAAIVAAWVELREPGETPMWLVAGVFFLACPAVAAAASARTRFPTLFRLSIGLALFATLYAIWIVNVQLPTHPGVWMSGGSRLSGFVMAALVSLAWYVAAGASLARIRKGSPLIALVVGGLLFTFCSAIAFYGGMITP